MQRVTTLAATGLLAVVLAACTTTTTTTGTRAPLPTSSGAPSGSPSSTDSFVLRGDDVCRAFDAAALRELGVTAPSRTPEPGGSAPVCVYPSADIAKRASIGLQSYPDTSLADWVTTFDTVIDTTVDGLPAASAAGDGLGCELGVEVGGGVLTVSGGGTDVDCRDVAPVASLAVAGLRALQ